MGTITFTRHDSAYRDDSTSWEATDSNGLLVGEIESEKVNAGCFLSPRWVVGAYRATRFADGAEQVFDVVGGNTRAAFAAAKAFLRGASALAA